VRHLEAPDFTDGVTHINGMAQESRQFITKAYIILLSPMP